MPIVKSPLSVRKIKYKMRVVKSNGEKREGLGPPSWLRFESTDGVVDFAV